MSTPQCLLCVLDEIANTERVPHSVFHGHTSSGYRGIRIIMPREGVPMRHGENRHLKTDKGVLNGSCKVIGTVAWEIIRNRSQNLEDGQEKALPVGGEDDQLNAKKLWHWPEGFEVLGHTHPKHGERIKAECNAEVVQNTNPEITRGKSYVSFLIGMGTFQDYRGETENRLQIGILEDASLDGEESVWVGDIDLGEARAYWPWVRYRLPTVHHDNQGSLASKEVNQELQEGVNGESFVNISQRIQIEGGIQRHDAGP